MSMKNSNDTIGNRTRVLPACSAVPQITAPPRVTMCNDTESKISRHTWRNPRHTLWEPLARLNQVCVVWASRCAGWSYLYCNHHTRQRRAADGSELQPFCIMRLVVFTFFVLQTCLCKPTDRSCNDLCFDVYPCKVRWFTTQNPQQLNVAVGSNR